MVNVQSNTLTRDAKVQRFDDFQRQDTIPYRHKIILHNYVISVPAGYNLIHWDLRDNRVITYSTVTYSYM